MDLTITANVTVLNTKSDMDAVADRVAAFNNGWYGAVTFEPGPDGPIHHLNIYRQGFPDILTDLGHVLITDASYIARFQSVPEYNAAHPENPIPES